MRTFVRDIPSAAARRQQSQHGEVPLQGRNMSEMLAGNRKISVTIDSSAGHVVPENASIDPPEHADSL
jgi:hypothetical protein